MMAWSSEFSTALEGYHVLSGGTSWLEQRQDKLWWKPGWGSSRAQNKAQHQDRIMLLSLVQLFHVLVPLSGTYTLTLGPAGFSHHPGLDLNVSSLEMLL